MSLRAELTGNTYGQLYISGIEKIVKNAVHWRGVCECGNVRVVLGFRLLDDSVQACVDCVRLRRFGPKVEIEWKFAATPVKSARITQLLTKGAKTADQLHEAVKGTLDSIMDCVAVLYDQGRISITRTTNDERLYSLKEAYPTHFRPEMGLMQGINSGLTS